MGQASADAAPVLELIAGQIGRTELGQDIIDQIDKIPGLQDQISALGGLKGYNKDATYLKGQMVVEGGRIYQASQAVPIKKPPPDATYWLDVGQSVETANGLAQQVSTNTTDITKLDGVVTASASSLQVLQAAYRDDTGEGDLADALQGYNAAASFAEEVKTRASQNEAMVQRQTELTASVGDVAGTVTDLESRGHGSPGHGRGYRADRRKDRRELGQYPDGKQSPGRHGWKTVDHLVSEDGAFIEWSAVCSRIRIGPRNWAWRYDIQLCRQS